MKRNRAFLCAVLIVLAGAAASTRAQAQSPEPATHDHTGAGGTPLMVPRDLEMRLAVNALPKPLRDGASVLFLEPTEYVRARVGTNAFTCMVSRRGGNFYPVFFDEEDTHTILPAYADDAVLRLKGATDQEVERRSADIPDLPFQGVLVQDPTLRKFVRIGYCASPTLRRLVDQLEVSSWIVFLQPGPCPDPASIGCLLHIVGKFEDNRYLRILVDPRGRPPDSVIHTLGHELQHAVEVTDASTPQIHDASDMLALFQRIGSARMRIPKTVI